MRLDLTLSPVTLAAAAPRPDSGAGLLPLLGIVVLVLALLGTAWHLLTGRRGRPAALAAAPSLLAPGLDADGSAAALRHLRDALADARQGFMQPGGAEGPHPLSFDPGTQP